MTIFKTISLSLVLVVSVSHACMTKDLKKTSKQQIKKKFTTEKRTPANDIQKFAAVSANPSWESKLGNLILAHTTKSIVLSVPAQIQKSSYHPFGDGQSNAKLGVGSAWLQNDFPVVGIQEMVQGKATRKYIFHPSLNVTSYEESLVAENWYKVQPKGWNDSFYFSYDTETLELDEFLNGIPEKLRTFSKNRIAPNIAKVSKSSGINGFKNLGEGYNTDPWYSDNVHGLFPDAGGNRTALGGVLTWGIVDKKFGPFKNLYTCF